VSLQSKSSLLLQFSGSVEAEVCYSAGQDSKNPRDFARLPTAFNREFQPRSINELGKKTTRGYPLLKFPDLTGWGV